MSDWGDWELYNIVCVSDDEEPEDFEEEIWDDAWTDWAESVAALEAILPYLQSLLNPNTYGR